MRISLPYFAIILVFSILFSCCNNGEQAALNERWEGYQKEFDNQQKIIANLGSNVKEIKVEKPVESLESETQPAETDDEQSSSFTDPVEEEPKLLPVVAPDPKPKAPMNESSTAGFNRKSGSNVDACISYQKQAFTVDIKPQKDVQLSSFYVYADHCGTVNISITKNGISFSTKKDINATINKIGLGDNSPELEKGKTYQLKVSTQADEERCQGNQVPKLGNIQTCKFSLRKSDLLTLKNKQGSFLLDLTFAYR